LALSLMIHAAVLMIPATVAPPLSLGTPAQAPGTPMLVTLGGGRNAADAILDGEPLPAASPTLPTPIVAVTPQEAPPGPDATTAEPALAARTTPFGEYLTPEQLTRTARPIWIDNLEAGDLRQITGEGSISMELLINEHGRVVAVNVLSTSVPAQFLRHTMRAFRNGNFEPGQLFDKPVKSSLRVEVRLETSGVQITTPRGPINSPRRPPPQTLPP
jgi:hypothetical protein